MKTLIIIIFSLLQACSSVPKINSFQFQSCVEVYCSDTEESVIKNAGLKIIEIAGSVYNIELNLNRGFCEEYYVNRDIDYRYLNKAAYNVCNGK